MNSRREFFPFQIPYIKESFEEESYIYNLPVLFEISNSLNSYYIHESLKILHERYDSLRSIYIKEEDRYLRITDDSSFFSFQVLVYSENLVNALVRNTTFKPGFPLFKVFLIKKRKDSLLLFIFSRSIMDRTSLQRFGAEFSTEYNSMIEKTDYILPYRQDWERICTQNSYFNTYYHGSGVFPFDIQIGLHNFCRTYRISPYQIFLTCYYRLISTFSGKINFTIDIPFRRFHNNSGQEWAIGCFTFSIPINIKKKKGEFKHSLLNDNGKGSPYGFSFYKPMELDLQGHISEPLPVPFTGEGKDVLLNCYERNGLFRWDLTLSRQVLSKISVDELIEQFHKNLMGYMVSSP